MACQFRSYTSPNLHNFRGGTGFGLQDYVDIGNLEFQWEEETSRGYESEIERMLADNKVLDDACSELGGGCDDQFMVLLDGIAAELEWRHDQEQTLSSRLLDVQTWCDEDRNSVNEPQEVGCGSVTEVQLSGGKENQCVITVEDFALELEWQLQNEEQPLSESEMDILHAGFVPEDASSVSNPMGTAGEPITQLPRHVLPPSQAIGVTYHKKNRNWEAHLWIKDKQLNKRKKKGLQVFLGNFKTKDEARTAHDLAALKYDVRETKKGKPYPLNFPEQTHAAYMKDHADWSTRDFVWKIRRFSHKFSKGKSRFKGVSVRKWKRKQLCYEAKITQLQSSGEKRTFDLGKYESEEEAGKAYDRALLFLKGDDSDCITNFRPSSYSLPEIEEAGRILQSFN